MSTSKSQDASPKLTAAQARKEAAEWRLVDHGGYAYLHDQLADALEARDDAIALARMVVEADGPGGTDSPIAQAARAFLAKAGA